MWAESPRSGARFGKVLANDARAVSPSSQVSPSLSAVMARALLPLSGLARSRGVHSLGAASHRTSFPRKPSRWCAPHGPPRRPWQAPTLTGRAHSPAHLSACTKALTVDTLRIVGERTVPRRRPHLLRQLTQEFLAEGLDRFDPQQLERRRSALDSLSLSTVPTLELCPAGERTPVASLLPQTKASRTRAGVPGHGPLPFSPRGLLTPCERELAAFVSPPRSSSPAAAERGHSPSFPGGRRGILADPTTPSRENRVARPAVCSPLARARKEHDRAR